MDEFDMFCARAYSGGADVGDTSTWNGTGGYNGRPVVVELSSPGKQTSNQQLDQTRWNGKDVNEEDEYDSGVTEGPCRSTSDGSWPQLPLVNQGRHWTRRPSAQVEVTVDPPSPPSRPRRSSSPRRGGSPRPPRPRSGSWQFDGPGSQELVKSASSSPSGGHHRKPAATSSPKPKSTSRAVDGRTTEISTRGTDESSFSTSEQPPEAAVVAAGSTRTRDRRRSSPGISQNNLLVIQESPAAFPGGRRRSTTCITPDRLSPHDLVDRSGRRNSSPQAVDAIQPSPHVRSRRNSAVAYLPNVGELEGFMQLADGGGSRSDDGGSADGETRRASTTSEDCPSVKSGGGMRRGSRSSSECGLRVQQKYRVMVCGCHGVGKTTLTDQLLTSEYLANRNDDDDVQEDENQVKMASILLDSEPCSVEFIDNGNVDDSRNEAPVDARLIVYSVTDRRSFHFAQITVRQLRERNEKSVVVLVANKNDLVRSRVIGTTEGRKLASKWKCRFLEVSALLDHKVDEVLATVVRACRSKTRRFHLENSDAEDSWNDLSVEETKSDKHGCLPRSALSLFCKFIK